MHVENACGNLAFRRLNWKNGFFKRGHQFFPSYFEFRVYVNVDNGKKEQQLTLNNITSRWICLIHRADSERRKNLIRLSLEKN